VIVLGVLATHVGVRLLAREWGRALYESDDLLGRPALHTEEPAPGSEVRWNGQTVADIGALIQTEATEAHAGKRGLVYLAVFRNPEIAQQVASVTGLVAITDHPTRNAPLTVELYRSTPTLQGVPTGELWLVPPLVILPLRERGR
jgi:hypothetical protein